MENRCTLKNQNDAYTETNVNEKIKSELASFIGRVVVHIEKAHQNVHDISARNILEDTQIHFQEEVDACQQTTTS